MKNEQASKPETDLANTMGQLTLDEKEGEIPFKSKHMTSKQRKAAKLAKKIAAGRLS